MFHKLVCFVCKNQEKRAEKRDEIHFCEKKRTDYVGESQRGGESVSEWINVRWRKSSRTSADQTAACFHFSLISDRTLCVWVCVYLLYILMSRYVGISFSMQCVCVCVCVSVCVCVCTGVFVNDQLCLLFQVLECAALMNPDVVDLMFISNTYLYLQTLYRCVLACTVYVSAWV